MAFGLTDRENRCRRRRHARSKRQSTGPLLQSRCFILQNPYRRVLYPPIAVNMLIRFIAVIVIINRLKDIERIHKNRRNNGIVIMLKFLPIMRCYQLIIF